MNRIIFILTLSAFLFSQQAEVANIQAAQRTDGSQIVDITYDLTEDEIFEEFTITVEVSFDGGSTFTAISNATGDFGEAILPGLGKTITWNFGQQFSDTYSDQVQYKITAVSDAIVVVEDEGCGLVPEGDIPFEMVHIPPGDFIFGGDITYFEGEPVNLWINSDIPIYGFQFDIIGGTLVDISGGLSSNYNYLETANNRVIGLTWSEQSIPPTTDILLQMYFEDGLSDLSIENIVLSEQGGCAIIQDIFEEMDGTCSNGDMNEDGSINVLDIVAIANCVLASNCDDYGNYLCDSQVDVLDAVAMGQCVLGGDCGGAGYCEASSSMTEENLWIEGDYTYGSSIETLDCNYEIMKYEVTDLEYIVFLMSAMEEGLVTVDSQGAWGPYVGDEVTSPHESIQYIYFGSSKISWNGSIFEVEEGNPNRPVIGTSYYGAYMFANYYGMELPTEFEWEKAARGMNQTDYPWGDDISIENANYLQTQIYLYGNNFSSTLPVGSFNGTELACEYFISNTFSWEDGSSTILGSYGNLANPANVGTTSGVSPYVGSRMLTVSESPLDGTPQAFLAWVTNLSADQEIEACFYGYDTTPSASPSMRIWGSWSANNDITSYQGTANGNVDFTDGSGWDQICHTFSTNDNGWDSGEALVIQARLYSGSSDPTVYFIDAIHVIAPPGASLILPGEDENSQQECYNDAIITQDSPSAFGAYDMAGNLSEWVQHELHGNDARMIRGGNFADNAEELVVNYKEYQTPSSPSPYVGFRCIRRLPVE